VRRRNWGSRKHATERQDAEEGQRAEEEHGGAGEVRKICGMVAEAGLEE